MKTILKLSVAFLVFASASAFANGSGYNGPDLNPVSIPVQLDRGISVGEIGQAINVCLAVGDSAHGLVSVMARAEKQVDPVNIVGPFEGGNYKATFETCNRGNTDGQNIGGMIVGHIPFANRKSPNGGRYDVEIDLNCNYQEGVSLYFPALPADLSSVYLQTRAGSFPYVAYAAILQDGGYDELGRRQDEKTIVNGLSIVVPADFESQGAAVPTFNSQTNQKTAVTLNAKEYVQCLISQIQK